MKSVFAAILAVAAAVASAQQIVTSRPASGQVIVAGSTTEIVWNPVDGVISTIDLRQGAASALSFLNTIATSVPATTGTYSWTVPADLATGTDYALSFGISPNDTYSPFFTIEAASGSSSAAASSSSAATTAAAASSSEAAVAPAASAAATTAKAATSAASSAASSAAASTTAAASGANKNVAAVGAMAVVGAVAAALL